MPDFYFIVAFFLWPLMIVLAVGFMAIYMDSLDKLIDRTLDTLYVKISKHKSQKTIKLIWLWYVCSIIESILSFFIGMILIGFESYVAIPMFLGSVLGFMSLLISRYIWLRMKKS